MEQFHLHNTLCDCLLLSHCSHPSDKPEVCWGVKGFVFPQFFLGIGFSYDWIETSLVVSFLIDFSQQQKGEQLVEHGVAAEKRGGLKSFTSNWQCVWEKLAWKNFSDNLINNLSNWVISNDYIVRLNRKNWKNEKRRKMVKMTEKRKNSVS